MRRLVATLLLSVLLTPWAAVLGAVRAECSQTGTCPVCATGQCRMMHQAAHGGMQATCAHHGSLCTMLPTDNRPDASARLIVSLPLALLTGQTPLVNPIRRAQWLASLAVPLVVAPASAPWEPPRR